MKPTKQEFKKLQDEWYKRLAEQGFKDIEIKRNNELVIGEHHSPERAGRKCEKYSIGSKAEYFRCLADYIDNSAPIFRNGCDQYIMTRFSEGIKIKEIIEELGAIGINRGRATIRFIIRKYEMAWGLKTYTLKQLNRK